MWGIFCFLLFYSSFGHGDEVRWEKNVVRRIEVREVNNFVKVPVKIDVNTAEKEDLMKLSGIGPKKALAIIEYRDLHGPFKKLEEISKVKGFSRKILQKILEKNKEIMVVN